MSQTDLGRLSELLAPLERLTFYTELEDIDSTLQILSRAAPLTSVEIFGGKVTGRGLAHLPADNLRSLTTGGDQIVDEDLQRFTNLIFLNLTGCPQVNGSCFLHMPQLETLHLSNSQSIAEAGCEAIGGLTHLQSVSLPNCPRVDSECLSYFQRLRELTTLNLSKTQVTDDGLQYLTGLQKIWYLDLTDTTVSDAGLDHLARLKNVRELVLRQTHVTPEAVAKMQQALPQCKISF